MSSVSELREKMLLSALLDREIEFIQKSWPSVLRLCLTTICKQLLFHFGLYPLRIHYLMRYRRKGAFVDGLREKRGLPPFKKGSE